MQLLFAQGQPPLGYDVQARRLIVNAREAETVRSIFRRYGELGSVRALRRRLLADGVTSKRRVRHDGHVTGGHPSPPWGAVLSAPQPPLPGRDRPSGHELSRSA